MKLVHITSTITTTVEHYVVCDDKVPPSAVLASFIQADEQALTYTGYSAKPIVGHIDTKMDATHPMSDLGAVWCAFMELVDSDEDLSVLLKMAAETIQPVEHIDNDGNPIAPTFPEQARAFIRACYQETQEPAYALFLDLFPVK